MALINLGSSITGISGKVGGQVYVNGNNGLFLKNRGTYPKSQSVAAKNSLTQMSFLSQHWRTLSSSHKQEWDALANQLKKINRLGNDRTPTGFETFMEWNRYSLLIGGTVNDSVRSQLHSFIAPGADTSTFEVTDWTVKVANVDTDCAYIVYLSEFFSPGGVPNNPSLLIADVLEYSQLEAGAVIPKDIMNKRRPQTLGNGILKPITAVNKTTGQPFHNYVRTVHTLVADP